MEPTAQPVQQPVQPVQPIQQAPQILQDPPSQSKSFIIVLGLIVVVIIFGAVVYLLKSSPTPPADKPSVIPTISSGNLSPSVKPSGTQTNVGPLLPAGTNDAQLQQDMQNIDTTIGSASSDLGNVDQGLNDKSVNLTE